MDSNVHNNWGRNLQATAKCDWCSKKNTVLLRCNSCYLNACRNCVADGHLEDDKHQLERASVNNFDWEKPRKGKGKDTTTHQSSNEPGSGAINNTIPHEQSIMSPVASQSPHHTPAGQPDQTLPVVQSGFPDYFRRPAPVQPYFGQGHYPTPMASFGPGTYPGQMGGMPFGGFRMYPYFGPRPVTNMMGGYQNWAGSPQGPYVFTRPEAPFTGFYNQVLGYPGYQQQVNDSRLDARSPSFVPEQPLQEARSPSVALDQHPIENQVAGQKRARPENAGEDPLAQERDDRAPPVRVRGKKKKKKSAQVGPLEDLGQTGKGPSEDCVSDKPQSEVSPEFAPTKLPEKKQPGTSKTRTTRRESKSTDIKHKDDTGANAQSEEVLNAAKVLVAMSKGHHSLQPEVTNTNRQLRRPLPDASIPGVALSSAPASPVAPRIFPSTPSASSFDKADLRFGKDNTSRGHNQPTTGVKPAECPPGPSEFQRSVLSTFHINSDILQERDGQGKPTSRAMALEDAWQSTLGWIIQFFGHPTASEPGSNMHAQEAWGKMQSLLEDDSPTSAVARIGALSISEKISTLLRQALQK